MSEFRIACTGVIFWTKKYRIKRGFVIFLPYKKFTGTYRDEIDSAVRRVRIPVSNINYIEER